VKIQYRNMLIKDYEDALALWKSLPGMGLSNADAKDHIEKFLKKNPHTCWIALCGDDVVGTILGGSDGRRGYLYHLAVHKDLHNQGIGKGLLSRCLSAFKRSGIQKCHIMVYHDNHAGIAFWQHVGWTIRKDVLTMSRELIASKHIRS